MFTNLIPGTYDVWMQDLANPGCVDLVTIVIPDPQDIITAIATVNSNLTCYGDSVGVATVNAIGGVLPILIYGQVVKQHSKLEIYGLEMVKLFL